MQTGALEITRATGHDNELFVKNTIAQGREVRHDWTYPAPWASQVLAGLHELSEAGMPETTPLTLTYASTRRSTRWYWVWNEDLTMMMGRPDPFAVVTTEWENSSGSIWTNCDKQGTTWLEEKAGGLILQSITAHPTFTVFQMTLEAWRGFLTESLLRCELNNRRQTLATHQSRVTGFQNSLNNAEKSLEQAQENLANLDDPDWLETAFEGWVESLRGQNERTIEQAQRTIEQTQRNLENTRSAFEEAQQAVEEAFEDWQAAKGPAA